VNHIFAWKVKRFVFGEGSERDSSSVEELIAARAKGKYRGLSAAALRAFGRDDVGLELAMTWV
jgi:hypothetical protein